MLRIGKITNTHGLKGEVKILSDFKYKEIIFQKNNTLYIDEKPLLISTHRIHKNLDMVTFEGINSIDDVLKYKGKDVFIDKKDYEFSGILNEDLIGKKVYGDGRLIGVLVDIYKNINQELLVVENNDKRYLIPYVNDFVKEIKEDIEINVIEGLIDEN